MNEKDIDEYSRDFIEMSVRYIVKVHNEFYRRDGVHAAKKLTINGHTVRCKCGKKAKRYCRGLKPICEKCWNKNID